LILTRIHFCCHGSTSEVARSSSVLELLIVAIEDIRSMIFQCVWKIARLLHLDLSAICTSFSAYPIHGCSQFFLRGLRISNAPLLKHRVCCTNAINLLFQINTMETYFQHFYVFVSGVTCFWRNYEQEKQRKH